LDNRSCKVRTSIDTFNLESVLGDFGEVCSDSGEDMTNNIDEEPGVEGDIDGSVGWIIRDPDVQVGLVRVLDEVPGSLGRVEGVGEGEGCVRVCVGGCRCEGFREKNAGEERHRSQSRDT
jgi:hypothetical protein